MDVLMISPGFPLEMPMFTRALAQQGARVHGIGDQGEEQLGEVRGALASYLQVRDLWDEQAVIGAVRARLGGRRPERVECLWEPGMMLAGRLREALGVPVGLRVEESRAFRDKETMKLVLDQAGVRTPRHARARTLAEAHAAAERIGFPLILKPIAGAGSADTHECRDQAQLARALELTRHVPELSVEEFIEGEELTWDTISAGGEILFENVAWYRPKPLLARLNEWISPQSVCLADLERPELRPGRELGRKVLRALRFLDGFAHMEWFLTPAGEAVFGEIGGRPPGGRLVHAMNYSIDADLFAGWAEAVCRGRLSQDLRKRYNAAIIFKRAVGAGSRITRVEGLEGYLARHAEHVAGLDLARPGDARRDWRQVVSGDGWVVVRHAELARTLELADRVGTDIQLFAD